MHIAFIIEESVMIKKVNLLKQYKYLLLKILNFTRAIELDSSKAEFFSNRGFVYRKLKEYEKAIKDYTESIKLNPSIYLNYFR